MSLWLHTFTNRVRAASRALARRTRAVSPDRCALAFGGGVLVVAVHLATAPSVGAAARGALVALAVALALVLGALFHRARRSVRVLASAAIGLGAMLVGLATSVPRALLEGAGADDVTGVLATIAALALLILAFRLALRGRGALAGLAVTIPACLVIAQWLIAPAVNAGVAVHAPRPLAAAARTLGIPGARDVRFSARDGVRLAGWYIPGRDRASVILLHGSHDTRADTLAHLRLLVDAGYGVLAYDARGHGASGGRPNALGWSGVADLAGAVSFLERRRGGDPRRIAALGLSMGAEEALRAAAAGLPLRAVVADGAGASTLGDARIAPHGLAPVFDSVTWLTMRAVELLTGEDEPRPLRSVVGRIGVPVLLIASNSSGERTTEAAYRRRIGDRARLWFLPGAGHTRGLSAYPTAYRRHVVGFLARALGGR